MVTIVLDSAILIEHFRGKAGFLEILIEKYKLDMVRLLVPTIVVFELWKGKSMFNREEEINVTGLIDQFEVVQLTRGIAEVAGSLEREGVARGNDALIAGTCLVEHAQLATLNRKDFAKVQGLQLWER